MKHAPATPLPWHEVPQQSRYNTLKVEDDGYATHAANAYPKLVAALCDCAVAVTRDGMQAAAARADLLLRELGEDA